MDEENKTINTEENSVAPQEEAVPAETPAEAEAPAEVPAEPVNSEEVTVEAVSEPVTYVAESNEKEEEIPKFVPVTAPAPAAPVTIPEAAVPAETPAAPVSEPVQPAPAVTEAPVNQPNYQNYQDSYYQPYQAVPQYQAYPQYQQPQYNQVNQPMYPQNMPYNPNQPVYPQQMPYNPNQPVNPQPMGYNPQNGQPHYYGQPQYIQNVPNGQPMPGMPPMPPQPPKKKTHAGVKIFVTIMAVLVAFGIGSFAASIYFHNADKNTSVTVEKHSESRSEESSEDESEPKSGRDDENSEEESEAVPEAPQQTPEEKMPDIEVPGSDGHETPDEQMPGDNTPDEQTPEESTPEESESTEEYTQPDIEVEPNTDGITIYQKPDSEELDAQEVYDAVINSCVTVSAKIPTTTGEYSDSTATGMFITEDGYIITNAHVIGDTKSAIVTITTSDGEDHECVTVGFDKTTDIAILKIDGTGYDPVEFGDASELSIGEWVIAIGNPGGDQFTGSLTRGVISGLDRLVGDYSSNGMTYIQTDAAINPGNSGGPLVNMYGQVVGINSSKIVADYYEGMGFAIPVSKAKDIIDELLSTGYVSGRVRLGITGTNVSSWTISGVQIVSIDDDSGFAGTDAAVGDVITAIDGTEVTSLTTLANALLSYSPGDTCEITLYRPDTDKELTVTITLIADEGQTQK